MLALSVKATALIPISDVFLTRSAIFEVDWRTENWELLWRWTKWFSKPAVLSDLFIISVTTSSLVSFLIFSDSSFRLRCFIPKSPTLSFVSKFNLLKISLKSSKSLTLKLLILINSKKALEVASTSADALWACWKSSLNKYLYSSIRVGNLNLPLPPCIWHRFAVFSVHVSRMFFSFKELTIFKRKNSAPTILISNFKLWPTIYFTLDKSELNFSRTSFKFSPILFAKTVDIPCTFSDSKGMSNPSVLIIELWFDINFPLLSCNCQANWTHLGQFSESEIGAFHFFGKPVVSVSKIKYIRNS